MRNARKFETREESIYCGFEGKYTLNRTARNRMKQARRAILRCGWTMCHWNDRHFYFYNEAGQKREICLYYNTKTDTPMISFLLDEGIWAAPECHITAWQLEHMVQTRPVAEN